MTTKIPVELSSTPGIADSSNATAITISSAEKVTFAKDIEIQGDSVSGSEGGHITLRAASGGSKEFGIDVDSSNNLRFITEDDGTGDNGAAHVYLTNAGLVAIGASSAHDSNALLTLSKSAVASSVLKSTTNTVTFANVANGSGSEAYSGTATNHPYYLMTNGAERLTIDTSGNATFVASAIIAASIVQSSTNAVHFMGGSTQSFGDTAGIGIAGGDNFHVSGSATGDIVMAAASGKHIVFGTSTSGNGPSRRFEIEDAGESSFVAGRVNFSAEGSGLSPGSHNGHMIDINGQSASGRAATNAQTHRSFLNPNGTVGSISTNGSATAFNTSSDYRLKENVVTDWDGTTLLKQLKPSKFNFKTDASTTLQGFLAHEVSSIVPQAVSGEKDAVYTAEEAAENSLAVEGQPNYQQIDQSKLVPLLVKTIQELEARITTLEGE